MRVSRLSERSKSVYSSIRESDDLVEELRKAGKSIIKLNSGDPALYFPTPRYIIRAYVEALNAGRTSYSRSQGVKELVEAIVGRYQSKYQLNLKQEDVIVTSGVAEGLTFLNSALLNANDTAVILKPYFTLYPVAIRMFGGEFQLGRYDESNNWDIDLDALKGLVRRQRLAHKGPKYLLLTNPNNPTGTLLSRAALQEVVEIVKDNDILLVSDEIYDEIVFKESTFTSVCELAEGIPHVVLNGASKAFDATGFRIGYFLIPEDDAFSVELKHKLADYCRARISANTPAQYAIASAMSNEKEHQRTVSAMVESIERIVNSAMKLLDENRHLRTVRPMGAFYIFPRIDMRTLNLKNDKEFVVCLLREKLVQTTRGSGFGAPDHFRIVALAPQETMVECIGRINDFCNKHSK